MDINFSDSIARLRSRFISLNSKENAPSNEENSSAANIRMPETDKNLNNDTFISSSKEKIEKKSANENNENLSVEHYKNAARAVAAMSQYRLNSSLVLRKIAFHSDKNIP